MWTSRKERLGVICDVGSATISAGIVLFREGQKIEILASVRLPISVALKPDLAHLEVTMIALLKDAFHTLSTEGLVAIHKQGIKPGRVGSVMVSLASPWYTGKTATLTIAEEHPFILDEKLVSNAISAEEKKFESEALAGQYADLKGKDIRMIERETTKVLLNGYETKHPYDQRATRATLSLYMSIVPETIVTAIEGFAKDYFHVDHVSFHTFPLVFFSVASTLFLHEPSYLLVDAAGESTDISLIRDGTLMSTRTFPIGRNTMLRTLMSDLHVNQDIAESYIKLSLGNTSEPTFQADIVRAIEHCGLEWDVQTREILQSFAKDGPAPHASFVVSNTEVASIWSNRMKKVGIEFGITEVVVVTPEMLSPHVGHGKNIPADEFLALEALFVDTHHSNGNI